MAKVQGKKAAAAGKKVAKKVVSRVKSAASAVKKAASRTAAKPAATKATSKKPPVRKPAAAPKKAAKPAPKAVAKRPTGAVAVKAKAPAVTGKAKPAKAPAKTAAKVTKAAKSVAKVATKAAKTAVSKAKPAKVVAKAKSAGAAVAKSASGAKPKAVAPAQKLPAAKAVKAVPPVPVSKPVAAPQPAPAPAPELEKKRGRRPRARIQSDGSPAAAWLSSEKPRPASFIPAPPRAEAPSAVAAPPASSDRLIRPDDIEHPAVRTVPIRVDVEQSAGRYLLIAQPTEVSVRPGEGIEWDFRYLGGADISVEEIVVEFEKPSPFAQAVFRTRKPGGARPHRQMSGAALPAAAGRRIEYVVRAMTPFRTELAKARVVVNVI